MFQEPDCSGWDMQSGFGQFSTVYNTQGKELMLPKFTEKSGCKNQNFCSSSFQINREHASRPTCFLQLSRHFILRSNPSQEDNQEKVWLVPSPWKVCPLTGGISSLGMLAGLSGETVQESVLYQPLLGILMPAGSSSAWKAKLLQHAVITGLIFVNLVFIDSSPLAQDTRTIQSKLPPQSASFTLRKCFFQKLNSRGQARNATNLKVDEMQGFQGDAKIFVTTPILIILRGWGWPKKNNDKIYLPYLWL